MRGKGGGFGAPAQRPSAVLSVEPEGRPGGLPTRAPVVAPPGQECDESMRALEVATDRARRLTSLRPEVAYQRLVSFLARRGYDGGTCREAARAALGLDGRHG